MAEACSDLDLGPEAISRMEPVQLTDSIHRGPKAHDLPFQFMAEKGRRDSIIGTKRYWLELLVVKKES
jgi:hypothetical protein